MKTYMQIFLTALLMIMPKKKRKEKTKPGNNPTSIN